MFLLITVGHKQAGYDSLLRNARPSAFTLILMRIKQTALSDHCRRLEASNVAVLNIATVLLLSSANALLQDCTGF